MIKRKFMYIGENERDDFFDFVPVNGEVYDRQKILHKRKGFDPDYTVLDAASAFFNDWKEVGQEAYTEQDFIHQCAIAAMKEFISSPERFPEALDLVNIPDLAFNVAEEMNEERKKRLKS